MIFFFCFCIKFFSKSQQAPIWAIDLDGLEEKLYQSTLKDNWGFKAMMEISDQTTLGKQFNEALKNQNKIDVYYFTLPAKMMMNAGGDMGDRVSVNSEGFAEGVPGATVGVTAPIVVYNMEEFMSLSSSFSGINPKDLESSFAAGKGVILVGVTSGMINAPQAPDFKEKQLANFRTSGAEVLLHEEWAHAKTLLEGKDIEEKKEHENYHGNETKSSPTATELLTPKYSWTSAGVAIRQIQMMAKKFYKVNENED